MKKLVSRVKSAVAKVAFAVSATALTAGVAVAQTANETAAQGALDSGLSLVQLVVGGLILIAAAITATAIVLRLLGR